MARHNSSGSRAKNCVILGTAPVRSSGPVKADLKRKDRIQNNAPPQIANASQRANSARKMNPKLRLLLVQLFVLLNPLEIDSILTEKPDFVNTCRIKEEDFVNCSTHAVQALFDEIPAGIPQIGLEPLDPLKVPVIKILQGTGPVNVNASLTNVTVLGFGNTKILLNKVDPKTHDFYTELHLPRLRIDGNYKLLGRILLIPLRGAGMCWFDAKNLDIVVKNVVDLVENDGFKFFKITGIHVKFSIGGLSLYMGNLFDGIKTLEESTNRYLNENWQVLADSLNPILTRTIENIMFDILRKVFDNIPADFFISDLTT